MFGYYQTDEETPYKALQRPADTGHASCLRQSRARRTAAPELRR